MPALQRAGLEGRVIRFDEWDDPDSFVRREGEQALRNKIDRARPLVEWALDRVIAPAEGDQVERKLTALEQAGEILGQLENRVAWEHYAQDISRRLDIEPKLLREYLQAPPRRRQQARRAVVEAHRPVELDKAEYGILVVLLDRPEWIEDFLDEEYDELLGNRQLADFIHLAGQHFETHDAINAALLLEKIDDPGFRNTVANALEPDGEYDPEDAGQWYRDCVRTLQRRWATRMVEQLQSELERLDFVEQRDRFEELHRQKQEIVEFRASLDNNSLN
jgi:DNA primase